MKLSNSVTVVTCLNLLSTPETTGIVDGFIKEVIEKSQTFEVIRAERPTRVKLGLRQIFIAWGAFRSDFPHHTLTIEDFIELAEAGEELVMLGLKIKLTQNIDEVTLS
jgi:hypothetical protein